MSNSQARPLFLDIALTSRCPLRCRYCSVEKEDMPELRAAAWKSIFASFARLRRIELISLEGGEPLLRPDLPEILSAALEYADSVKIVTSGAIPLGSIPLDLIRHPRFFLEASMDGPREVHNFLRDFSWDPAWDFIRKGLDQGARIHLRSVISRLNLPLISNWLAEIDLMLARYGRKIGFTFDTLISPEALTGKGGPIPRLGLRYFTAQGLMPRPSDMGKLFQELKSRNFKTIEVLQTEPLRGCGAARRGVISFDPAGAFSFCCEAPGALGSLSGSTAEQILSLLDFDPPGPECQDCLFFYSNLCHGCWTGEKCGMVGYWGAGDCRALYGWMTGGGRGDRPSGFRARGEPENWALGPNADR